MPRSRSSSTSSSRSRSSSKERNETRNTTQGSPLLSGQLSGRLTGSALVEHNARNGNRSLVTSERDDNSSGLEDNEGFDVFDLLGSGGANNETSEEEGEEDFGGDFSLFGPDSGDPVSGQEDDKSSNSFELTGKDLAKIKQDKPDEFKQYLDHWKKEFGEKSSSEAERNFRLLYILDKTLEDLVQLKGSEEFNANLNYWRNHSQPKQNSVLFKDLLVAQRNYELLLLINNGYNGSEGTQKAALQRIMDTHKTLGVEWEFAYYNNERAKLQPHTVLASQSGGVLSSIAGGGFALETDSNNKLEMVFPPLLVTDEDSLTVLSNMYDITRNAVAKKRPKNANEYDDLAEFKDELAKELGVKLEQPHDKLGSLRFDPQGLNLSGNPDDLNKGGYGQINIALTNDELITYSRALMVVERRAADESSENQKDYHWVYDIYDNLFKSLGVVENQSTRHLLAMELAKIVAMPSIIANNSGKEDLLQIHSNVKELFGVWVKDNAPNVILGSINPGDKESLKAILQDAGFRRSLMAIINSGVVDKIKKVTASNEVAVKTDTFFREYGETMEVEVNQLLDNVVRGIDTGESFSNPAGVEFGKETFGNGLGMRKDTFVTIPSGERRKLHLAEVRSDWMIRRMLLTSGESPQLDARTLLAS